jgi:hypothetical protein
LRFFGSRRSQVRILLPRPVKSRVLEFLKPFVFIFAHKCDYIQTELFPILILVSPRSVQAFPRSVQAFSLLAFS